ncbi:MAG: substrate-binding domain-containing protein, partial [Actinomycetota bacterium]|nr:substrate-binding domain-containing protein [Actinomycetota bacterium]
TLNLSPTTLSAIFSGRTTRWDDASIRADNAGARLPSTAIRVVHRSDPSGTTQAFSRFLRDAAPGSWTLGSGPTLSWATGVGADGSDGVVAAVAATSGSVGYVEAGQATRAGLGVAAVENGAGRFVLPTSANVGSAVGGANPEAPEAYPIAALSQVVFSTAGVEGAKRTALRHFVAWTLTEGQRSADRLGYSPVPLPVLVNAIATVQATEDPGPGRP